MMFRRLGNLPVLRLVTLIAVSAILLGVMLIVVSIKGTNDRLFGFNDAHTRPVPTERGIDGWSTFDRESYLPGDTLVYSIHIVWQSALVTPSLDKIRGSVNVHPLDQRASQERERALSGERREYIVRYELQAVDVEFPSSLRLDPVTVYYTSTEATDAEVQVLQIRPPMVHFGERYPQNVTDIPLLPPKPEFQAARALRQWIMASLGATLLATAAALLWHYGRRRPDSAISEAERLWRQLQVQYAVGNGIDSNRAALASCESLFTRALELRSGIGPIAFWAGSDGGQGEWCAVMNDARSALSKMYQPGEPSDQCVERVRAVIGELLEPMVREERLRREEIAPACQRLRNQPSIVLVAGVLSTAAMVLLVMAALPTLWLSKDLQQYNRAVAMSYDGNSLERALDEFRALVEGSRNERVRSAASYNLGTLLVDPSLSGLSTSQYKELLNLLFLPNVTGVLLMHELELDAETELLTILAEVTRRHVAAEAAMKTSVRLRPGDEHAVRNLELLAKVRRAIANSLERLAQRGDQETGPQALSSQLLIDLQLLMEMALPKDFAKSAEGKDDRNYFIMEGF